MTTIIYQPFDKAQDVLNPQQADREAAYQLLFDVFTWLEPEHTGSGPRLVKSLCDGDGEPVETLAEVIAAVEDGELRCPVRVEWLGAQ